MEAYADPLQYFEPDPPNDVKPEEVSSSSALSFVSILIIIFCDMRIIQ